MTQGLGGESILFMLQCLACGHVMVWNALFKKDNTQNSLLEAATFGFALKTPKICMCSLQEYFVRNTSGKDLRSSYEARCKVASNQSEERVQLAEEPVPPSGKAKEKSRACCDP